MFHGAFSDMFNKNSHNATNSFNTTYNTYHVTEAQSRILQWLSLLEPWDRHHDVASSRVEGIGGWIFEKPEFKSWLRCKADGEPVDATLFCSGAPGAGKTYMCSLITDALCDNTARFSDSRITEANSSDETLDLKVGVACLYCDYHYQTEHNATSMIGGLLKQFVIALPEIPNEIVQAFNASKEHLGGRGIRQPKILELFPRILSRFRETFICIDALDELLLEQRAELLRLLKQVLQKSPTTRLLLTGRPQIYNELPKNLTGSAGTIVIQPSKKDIKAFIAAKLDNDPDPEVMSDQLKSEIMAYIPDHFSEIFLLVTLHIDAVLGELTIFARRRKLYNMASGLGDAYSATLERLKQQKGDKPRLGMGVLAWVALADRPLRASELCHALAVEFDSKYVDDENVPLIKTLLGCCVGLVSVDRETSTVRLVHVTLHEYLRGHPTLFQNCHGIIASVCLTYLNFEQVKELPVTLKEAPEELPLLQYASSYWGIHAREEPEELPSTVEPLAVELLRQYDTNSHISAAFFLRPQGWSERQPPPVTQNFTGLHCIAALGITEIAVVLLEMGSRDMNLQDDSGRTALAWATLNGHEQMVELLLGYEGVMPDLENQLGQTPLSLASKAGHEGVVNMLLSRIDVSPNRKDYAGRTPLSYAVEDGHERVVKLLLNHSQVKPDEPDSWGRTPFSWAVQGGHESLVKIFLARGDVNPEIFDKSGRTPISWASRNGHEAVLRLLLDRTEVNPDSADSRGRTPLSWAAGHKHEGAVKLLLERRDVKLDTKDSNGRTPLSMAAASGSANVVSLLLYRKEVDPNSADNDGQTPLFWAAISGHEGVVQQFLDYDFVNPNLADKSGRTPLSGVAGRGRNSEGITKLLLSRADVNTNPRDEIRETPLLRAAANGHKEMVELLLSRDDVDPNWINYEGCTPLAEAARYGHKEIVGLLLAREDINSDPADFNGNTPLAHAAMRGHKDIVIILLGHENVFADTKNRQGRTPLSLAAGEGHAEVVEILMGCNDVDAYSKDKLGQTPLSWADEGGWARVVELIENYSYEYQCYQDQQNYD